MNTSKATQESLIGTIPPGPVDTPTVKQPSIAMTPEFLSDEFKVLAAGFDEFADAIKAGQISLSWTDMLRFQELNVAGGQLIIDAVRAGLLTEIPFLITRVAWHTRKTHQNVPRGLDNQGPQSLFFEVVGEPWGIPTSSRRGEQIDTSVGLLNAIAPNYAPPTKFMVVATMEPSQLRAASFLRYGVELYRYYAKACRLLSQLARSKLASDEHVNLTPRNRALALVRQHGDWTYKQLADEVGVHLSTVKRWPEIKALKKVNRQYKPPPRGSKGEDGELEAVDE
ncbi:MAG: hypothetical protein IT445_13465 [Phycisphaeraceae bacterium]|nr:hypothetical protein [Phycisphaeraceae bacterium]